MTHHCTSLTLLHPRNLPDQSKHCSGSPQWYKRGFRPPGVSEPQHMGIPLFPFLEAPTRKRGRNDRHRLFLTWASETPDGSPGPAEPHAWAMWRPQGAGHPGPCSDGHSGVPGARGGPAPNCPTLRSVPRSSKGGIFMTNLVSMCLYRRPGFKSGFKQSVDLRIVLYFTKRGSTGLTLIIRASNLVLLSLDSFKMAL